MNPTSKHNKDLGKEGELEARNFLLKAGYEILECNYRIGKDEIDIVAKEGNELVLVEVKTRATNTYGVPEDFITAHKEACMIRAAEQYILENDWDGPTRFDVIAIYYAGRKPRLYHIPDAFYPRA